MSKLTQSAAWQNLQKHKQSLETVSMRQLFAEDPNRFRKFSLQLGNILFDYSKNRITKETVRLLLRLAEETGVAGRRDEMFAVCPERNQDLAVSASVIVSFVVNVLEERIKSGVSGFSVLSVSAMCVPSTLETKERFSRVL